MSEISVYHQENSYISILDGKLHYFPSFLDDEVATKLLHRFRQELAWREDNIKMFGKVYKIPRLQAWYGDSGAAYKYSGIQLPINEWHKELVEIRMQIEKLTGEEFNSVLANWYRGGQDSNGWHADNEKELGENPIIASISLGAERVFQMKHRTEKNQKLNLTLQHGSLLLMKDKTQHFWLHQIAKSKKVQGDRINLTFRNVLISQS